MTSACSDPQTPLPLSLEIGEGLKPAEGLTKTLHANQGPPVTGSSFLRMAPSLYGSPCSSSCKRWVSHERLRGKTQRMNLDVHLYCSVAVATARVSKTIMKTNRAITVKEAVVFEASSAEERVEGVQRLLPLHGLSERAV